MLISPQFPNGNYLNGTITTNTTGVRTNATCSAPARIDIDTSNPTNFSISAQSLENFAGASSSCSVTVNYDPKDANQQYGVNGVDNCGPNAGGNRTFLPVFFWFYRNNSGIHQEAGVFCAPTLEVFTVAANASMNDGSLGNVSIIAPIDDYANNNVTGVPQNGIPFNG